LKPEKEPHPTTPSDYQSAPTPSDVTSELARATITSVTVLGALHASSEVKAALADRMH